MMWLLLFSATVLIVLLPLWPAFEEWRRPSDAEPLHIDSEDALDPLFLARDFTTRLDQALGSGLQRLGKTELALAPEAGAWPLSTHEQMRGASERIWCCGGVVSLPSGIRFLAEVAARQGLRGAHSGRYQALWSGGRLQLGPQTTLQRWAHGQHVEVGDGCRLVGRVSADRTLTLHGGASFGFLHAPLVRFEPVSAHPQAMPAVRAGAGAVGLPSHVRWDGVAGRGVSDNTIRVAERSGWRGELVSRVDIVLGQRCAVDGSLKAHGAIQAAAGCIVSGSLVAGGAIELGPQSSVFGSVVSETRVVLGADCTVGAPGRPATVAAPVIEVSPGVVVHGTLWAGRSGHCGGAVAAPTAGPPAAQSKRKQALA